MIECEVLQEEVLRPRRPVEDDRRSPREHQQHRHGGAVFLTKD